jgi:hypothetical protein
MLSRNLKTEEALARVGPQLSPRTPQKLLYIFTLKLIFAPGFLQLYMYIDLTSCYQNVSYGLLFIISK